VSRHLLIKRWWGGVAWQGASLLYGVIVVFGPDVNRQKAAGMGVFHWRNVFGCFWPVGAGFWFAHFGKTVAKNRVRGG